MMEQLLQQILLALEQAGMGENCRLVAAFPPSRLPHPLSRACVAVGFRNLTVSDGALGRYWGKMGNNAVNAGQMCIRDSCGTGAGPLFGGWLPVLVQL